MTTPEQTPRTGPYTGDGSATVFAYNFWLTDDDEAVVIIVDSNGDETVQTLTTHYTVSGVGTKTGGNITFVTAPASGEEVWFLRDTPREQTTDLQNRRVLRAQTVEDRLDDAVRMIQDLYELLDRAIIFSVSAAAAGVTFPAPAANQVIAWNSAGDNLTNRVINDDVLIDVPASSTDNAIVRWDGTGGNSFLNSGVIIDDAASMTGIVGITISGNFETTAGNVTVNNTVITAHLTMTGNFTLGGYGVNDILDEDNMASDDANALATQQSIKAYVDSVTPGSTLGQHTSLFLANALVPTTTNGAAVYTAELATNDVMIDGLAFDDSTEEHAQVLIQMPKSWDAGTLVFQFVWTTAGGASGNVIWGIQGRAFADGDAYDQAWGTAQEVTDAWQADDDCHITAETSALTLGGGPLAEEAVIFDIYRKAADASDTMTGDAILQLVRMHYTTDAATDG